MAGKFDEKSDKYRMARLVSPSDSADLPLGECRALWVGGAGALNVILADDTSAVLMSAVPAGTLLPIAVKRVMAASTGATLIVALY